MYAKGKADILVASLTSDAHINKANFRPFVPQDLRAMNLAALEMVDYVVIDEAFYRPAEVDLLIGDPAKAKAQLGWTPTVGFEDLVTMMVDADLARLRPLATSPTR